MLDSFVRRNVFSPITKGVVKRACAMERRLAFQLSWPYAMEKSFLSLFLSFRHTKWLRHRWNQLRRRRRKRSARLRSHPNIRQKLSRRRQASSSDWTWMHSLGWGFSASPTCWFDKAKRSSNHGVGLFLDFSLCHISMIRAIFLSRIKLNVLKCISNSTFVGP